MAMVTFLNLIKDILMKNIIDWDSKYFKKRLDVLRNILKNQMDDLSHPVGPCTARYHRLVETKISKQFSDMWKNRYGY